MLILVGVTLTVVLNGGLFKTAQKASAETQMEADREVLQAVVAASIDSDSLTIKDINTLQSNLPKDWSVSKKSEELYEIKSPKKNIFKVTQKGEILEDNWIQSPDGKSVIKGKMKLDVGAVVGEDLNVNGKLPELDNGNKWAVLGVENGKILLATTNNLSKDGLVKKLVFNGRDDIYKEITIEGTDIKTTVIDENKIDEKFNKFITETCGVSVEGTVADSIRSIKAEDINRVTTYNPENIGLTHDGGRFDARKPSEYGNKVKYKAGETILSDNGAGGKANSVCQSPKTTENSEFTVKSNYYSYYPETLTTSSGTKPTNTPWYNLLFERTNTVNGSYYLDSPYAYSASDRATWGLHRVYNGFMQYSFLFHSINGPVTDSYGARAVISLPSNIEIEQK